MGFMTVAFILNDFMGDIKRCPNQVLFMLTNPRGSDHPVTMKEYHDDTLNIGHKYKEKYLPEQALRVFPYFHTSEIKYFIAGGNTMNELEFFEERYQGNVKYIMLKAPDYMQDRLK